MDPNIISTIKEEQELRDTNDLIETWQQHDLEAWTEEAFEAIRQILQQRLGDVPPQDDRRAAQGLLALAEKALENDQPDLALERSLQAVDAAPHYARAYKAKGEALTDLEKYDQALEAYKKALSLDPQLADLEESMRITRELREKYPLPVQGRAEADQLLNQVQPLVEANRLEEALVICDAAVQAAPAYAKAHHARGLILDELGRLHEAVTAYREALRLDPDLEDAILDIKYAAKELSKNAEKGAPEA